jgi:signal recognition particle GTPase
MPNPLGRNRRIDSGSSDSSAEVARLKDELNELRKMYMQDMASVSSDMRVLVSQLAAQTETPTADVSHNPVVDNTDAGNPAVD